jgi:hypothetical protein
MKRTIQILVVLFIAQVALAIAMNYQGSSSAAPGASAMLITAKRDKIDHIAISDSDGKNVTLAKSKEGWVLPDKGNFPADGSKVDDLIGKLVKLKEGLPIATTDGSLKRFKLTDKNFERKIVLSNGKDKLATVYLGTSQGAHEVHARRDDQNEVYAVTMGAYQAPGNPDDWIDATLLQMPAGDVAELDVDGLKVKAVEPAPAKAKDDKSADKSGDKASDASKKADNKTVKTDWQLVDAKPGETLDPKAATKLAAMMARLRITSVLGTDTKPDYGMDKPVLDLSLMREGKGMTEYKIGKMPGKDGDYVLKLSSRPEYFRIPAYTGNQLVKAADRKALLVQPKDDAKKADDKAGDDAKAPSASSN